MHDHQYSSLVAESTDDIARLLHPERTRLRKEAGLVQLQHFKKPKENAFTSVARGHVKVCRARTLSTPMSSSRRVRVVRAASACMRPNIVLPCRMPASMASGYCCFSNRKASKPHPASRV